jgi:hypothetical protein
MPVTLETLENGQVQYYRGSDPWSMRELMTLYIQDQAHRNSVDHTVHTIMDLSHCKTLPQGVLSGRVGAPGIDHPRAGYVILVGFNNFARTLGELALKLKHFPKAVFVQSEEAAWAFLHEKLQNENQSVSTSTENPRGVLQVLTNENLPIDAGS